MQKAYIEAICSIMDDNPNAVYLIADSGTHFDQNVFRDYPERCFNIGIAESNLIGVAAGLAQEGRMPIVMAQGAFLAFRAFEFIRDDLCLQNLHCVMIGTGSGLSLSTLGPTHHTLEDVGVLRTLPNLTLFSPSTPKMLTESVLRAANMPGPIYIRMEDYATAELYECVELRPTMHVRNEGGDTAFVSYGTIIGEVLKACDMLMADGISADIFDVQVLKPFDIDDIFCDNFENIFIVEEHNISCGLGSLVATAMAKQTQKPKIHIIGLQDSFARSYGTIEEIRKINGYTCHDIYKITRMVLDSQRKEINT